MGQRRRFSRACTGNDQQRFVAVIGSRPLFGVEVGQQKIESYLGLRRHP